MKNEKRKRSVFALTLAGLIVAAATPANAQKQQGCFVGRDQAGAPTIMRLVSEKIGRSFEIYGTVSSQTVGTMRVKADGWSGAGRLFRAHEFEGGAMFIQFSNYTGSSFTFSVQGIGSFPFKLAQC